MANQVTVERLVAEISVNAADAKRELAALETKLDATMRDRKATIELDVDGPSRAEVEAKVAAATKGVKANVPLDVDNDKVRQTTNIFDGLTASLFKANVGAGALFATFKGGTVFFAIASAVGPAATAITSLGAAFVGLTATLGSALGVLAAFPAAIAAIGQAAIGLSAIFNGVGSAISIGNTQAKERRATNKSAAGAKDHRSVSYRNEAKPGPNPLSQGGPNPGADPDREGPKKRTDEERERWQAERDARFGIKQNRQALRDARRAEGDAETNLIAATQGVSDARKEAKERVEDLRMSLDRLRLSEKQATANTEDAQRRLAAVNADQFATEQDKRDALLAVEAAQQSQVEIEDARKDTAKELRDREEAGIRNSPEVIAAINNQIAAMDALQAAQERVEAADYRLQRSREELKDMMKAFRKEVAAGAGGGGGGGGGGFDPFQQALEGLAESAQTFVKMMVEDFLPPLREIGKEMQEIFFREGGIPVLEALIDLLPQIRIVGLATATALGAVGASLAEFIGGDQFREDFEFLGLEGAGHIQTMGEALVVLSEGLVNIMVAAAPFTEWVMGSLSDAVERFKDWTEIGRNSGSFEDFLGRTRESLGLWGGALKQTIRLFRAVGSAAMPLGTWILQSWEDNARAASEWAESFEGQNSMKQFFEDMKQPLSDIARFTGQITRAFVRLGQEGAPAFTDIMQRIEDDLGPALKGLFEAFESGDFAGQLVGMLASLTRAFTALVDQGGALRIFVDVLTGLFDAFVFLANLPGASNILKLFTAFKTVQFSAKFMSQLPILGPALKLIGGRIKLVAIALKASLTPALVSAMVPMLPWIALAAAVALAAVLIWKNWDKIGPKVMPIIEGIGEAFQEVWQAIEPTVNIIKDGLIKYLKALMKIGRGVINFWTGVFTGDWSRAWEGIKQIVAGFIEAMGASVVTLLSLLREWATNLGPQIIGWLGDLGVLLHGWMGDAASWLAESLLDLFLDVSEWFGELPGKLIGYMKDWGRDLRNWMREGVASMFGKLGDFFSRTRTWFSALPGRIVRWAAGLGRQFIGWMRTGVSELWGRLGELFTRVGNWFTGLPGRILGWIRASATSLGERLITWAGSQIQALYRNIGNIFSDIRAWFRGLPQRILDWIGDIKDDFLTVGENIVAGIKQGIQNGWEAFTTWLLGKVGSLIDSVLGKLGINSPSRVFRDIGAGIMEGMTLGVKTEFDRKTLPETMSVMAKLIDEPEKMLNVRRFQNPDAFSSRIAGGSAISNVSTKNNNMPITINVAGNPNPQEVAREAWWAVRSGVRR